MAGLDSGLITPGTVVNDPGSVRIGNVTFRNARNAVNGAVALRKALQVSSDVYYYIIGRDDKGKHDIQKWARRLGPRATRRGSTCPAECPASCPTRSGATSCSRTS